MSLINTNSDQKEGILETSKTSWFRQPNILQSPLKELVSSPFLQGRDQHEDPAKSPTSKMMIMNRQNTKEQEEYYRPVQINPKIPKQSQKIIDFDNMSSFESEAESRSKNKSYLEQEDIDRETQDFLNRKCRFFWLSRTDEEEWEDSEQVERGWDANICQQSR